MNKIAVICLALLTGCQAHGVAEQRSGWAHLGDAIIILAQVCAWVFVPIAVISLVASVWRECVCQLFRIAPHDPGDRLPSISATKWRREPYCPKCHSFTTDSESHIGICRTCGGSDVSRYYTRVFREIWNGRRMVYQLENGKVVANIYAKPNNEGTMERPIGGEA